MATTGANRDEPGVGAGAVALGLALYGASRVIDWFSRERASALSVCA
jgi:hypothetical protein